MKYCEETKGLLIRISVALDVALDNARHLLDKETGKFIVKENNEGLMRHYQREVMEFHNLLKIINSKVIGKGDNGR